MTANRSVQTVPILITGMLLLALNASAAPREVRLQSANGDGGNCPGVTASQDDSTPTTPAKRPAHATVRKARSAPMVRSGEDAGPRPRWHSFLPGMFR